MKEGMTYDEAEERAMKLMGIMLASGATHVETTGSIRRKDKIVGDIDLLIEGDLAAIVKEARSIHPEKFAREQQGKDKSLTVTFEGHQVNLFKISKDHIGAARFAYTGPKNYVIAYRCKARAKGWTLNQYGLFDENDKLIEAESEHRIYQLLDKEWKAPERRGKR
jgi:DNA polymerase (family 10)